MRVRVLLNIILKNRTCTIALPTKCYKNHYISWISYTFSPICVRILCTHILCNFVLSNFQKIQNTIIRKSAVHWSCNVYILYHIRNTNNCMNYYHNTSVHIHWSWLSYKQPFQGKRNSFFKNGTYGLFYFFHSSNLCSSFISSVVPIKI